MLCLLQKLLLHSIPLLRPTLINRYAASTYPGLTKSILRPNCPSLSCCQEANDLANNPRHSLCSALQACNRRHACNCRANFICKLLSISLRHNITSPTIITIMSSHPLCILSPSILTPMAQAQAPRTSTSLTPMPTAYPHQSRFSRPTPRHSPIEWFSKGPTLTPRLNPSLPMGHSTNFKCYQTCLLSLLGALPCNSLKG